MRYRKLLTAAIAVTIAGSGVFAINATVVSAEDEITETPVEVVEAPPAPEEAPVEEPLVEPVLEEPAVEEVIEEVVIEEEAAPEAARTFSIQTEQGDAYDCPAGTDHEYKIDNLSGKTFVVPTPPAGWTISTVTLKVGGGGNGLDVHQVFTPVTPGQTLTVTGQHDISHAHICKNEAEKPKYIDPTYPEVNLLPCTEYILEKSVSTWDGDTGLWSAWTDYSGAGPLNWGQIPDDLTGHHGGEHGKDGDRHFAYVIKDQRPITTGDCAPKTPVTPTFTVTPPTCWAAGSITINQILGVIWTLNQDGSYTASAAPNFVLTAPVSTPAPLGILTGEPCQQSPECVTTGSTVITKASDFASTDIRTSGHFVVVGNQAHVWTTDNSGQAKVAGYVSAPGTQIGSANGLVWTGSSPAPGTQIVLSDGSILVGESVYGANLWLTNGSSAAMKAVAPHTGGGNGSNWFGTAAEWQNSIETAGRTVVAVGFSLGSGVLGDGLLTSVTAGCHTITFAQSPQPDDDVTTVDNGEPVCGSDIVDTKTTTVSYTYDTETGVWEAGEPVVTYGTRPITEEEAAALDEECVANPNPNAIIETDCGVYSITLSNDVDLPEGYTAPSVTFVVTIDGVETEYEIEANGDHVELDGTFLEDSGDHLISVGLEGSDAIMGETVETDCLPPVTTIPEPPVTTTPEPPVTTTPAPPVTTTPAVPVPAPTTVPPTAPSPGPLPVTGSSIGLILALGAALAGIGGVMVAVRRRRPIEA